MEIIDVLKEKLNKISENIPENEWSFFHKKSITNFILYIDLIKDKTEKEKTSQILLNYLKDVELNFKPDIDYSLYIFNNYLESVVPAYQNRLGFWPVPNKNALAVYIIAIILVFIALLNNLFLEVLFCSILVLFLFKIFSVLGKHKVFGFRY
jgi:hypothetical protein